MSEVYHRAMVNVKHALETKRGRKRRTDKKKAVAYIRVSTDRQELGPEAQRAAIEAYARSSGLEVAAWHEEAVSGAAPLSERVELFAAIATAKQIRAGAIIVAKRDRFARDAFVTELLGRDLAGVGIDLVSAEGHNGDSPEAILLRRMLDAVAEYERALISARTKAALAAKKRRGQRGPGSVPYGKRLAADGETLEDEPSEAAVVRRIIDAFDNGSRVSAIVRGLEAEGVPPRGAGWHRTTVVRILCAHGRKPSDTAHSHA
jgi:site-specific DNA recombinase